MSTFKKLLARQNRIQCELNSKLFFDVITPRQHRLRTNKLKSKYERLRVLVNERALKHHTMYLDWFNNFITAECFAEYYNIPLHKAIKIIETQRKNAI